MSELFGWRNHPKAKHIISLGAGVQSSTMLKMADMGLIKPRPIAAIFADTQAEPKSVYTWLDWLETQVSIPIIRVTQGSLEQKEYQVRRSKKSGKVYKSCKIPAFTRAEGEKPCACRLEYEDLIDRGEKVPRFKGCEECGGTGRVPDVKVGLLPRKCTSDYKLQPLFRRAKELAEVPKRNRIGVYVIQWVGISTDEVMRMKPSRESWAMVRWPLIEMNISRQACLDWWKERNMPAPPRSACVFCPYHNDNEWMRLKTEEPAEFARAVKFERKMQKAAERDEVSRGKPFLHRECKPLDEVEFKPKEKPTNLFNNECEGMCGQ